MGQSNRPISNEEKAFSELISKVNKIQDFVQQQSTTRRMEERFQDVPFKTIYLKQQEIDRQEQLKQWLGVSCKEIFSIGFALFKAQQLDGKKVKSFCSENILRHILQLSQTNKLSPSDFKLINKFLEEDLLPYFLHKYPISQSKETHLGFSQEVIQVNNLINVQNDLIFASKVKFKFRQNGIYNDKIMEFLNYLISLPEQEIQGNNLYNSFVKEMEGIFKTVEVEDEMLKMKNLSSKIQKKTDPEEKTKTSKKQESESINLKKKEENLFKSVEVEDEMLKMTKLNSKIQNPEEKAKTSQKNESESINLKQKEQYKEKVKSYTSYNIGRKLSENLKKFSSEEIQSCNLVLKNNALMRVITKWCEELEKCFTQNFIIDRQQQFRMMDGSTKFLKNGYLVILQALLKRQKEEIDKKMQSLMEHNYSSQSDFSKMEVNKKFAGFMKEEAMVGQFSSKVFRNNQSYLVSYLNNLLHGILTATRDLNKVLRMPYVISDKDEFALGFNDIFQQFTNGQIKIDKFICLAEKNINGEQKNHSYNQKTPQLITFLIGDLLRCKCSSHQNEIIALFNKIQQEISKQKSNFKLVRVKNRLQSSTKDILMNIMYKNKLIIEIQLAINTDKTKFLDCSNCFNHYLYQLKRSRLGPLSELCNIWTELDFRGNFYLEKMEKLNLLKKDISKKIRLTCCDQKQNRESIKQPFECSQCGVYYSEVIFAADNIRCTKCNNLKCLKCRLKQHQGSPRFILSFLPSKAAHAQVSLNIPSQGLLVNLKSFEQNCHFFKKIQYKKSIYLFGFEQKSNKHVILNVITGQDEEKIFLKDHYILKGKIFQKKTPKITLEQAKFQFLLPHQLKVASQTSKSSISLVKQGLKNHVFENFQNVVKNWPAVKKINFSFNNLENLSQISERFQNAQTVVLDDNKITQVKQDCKKLQKVQEMTLSSNKIENIENIVRYLTTITILDVSLNEINSISQNLGNLERLKMLDLSYNKLKKIPSSLGNLFRLKKLNIHRNQITELPESIGSLKNLNKLNMHYNELTKLPQSFCDLCSLVQLNVSYNKLQALPEKIDKLKYLKKIYAKNNSLKQLPSNFGLLSHLLQASMRQNKLTELPLNIVLLKRLSEFDLDQSQLSQASYKLFQKLKLSTSSVLQKNSQKHLESEESSRFYQPKTEEKYMLQSSNINSDEKLEMRKGRSVGIEYNENYFGNQESQKTFKNRGLSIEESERSMQGEGQNYY